MYLCTDIHIHSFSEPVVIINIRVARIEKGRGWDEAVSKGYLIEGAMVENQYSQLSLFAADSTVLLLITSIVSIVSGQPAGEWF
jgi:hypothetical protein